MNKIFLILFFSFSLPFLIEAQENLHKENIAATYRPNDTSVHPIYKIYHTDDSTSLVFYEVNLSELTYRANPDSSYHYAEARFHYELYMNYKAKLLVDSGSTTISDYENYGKNNSSLGYFPIKVKEGYSYVIKITLTDLNNNNSSINLLDIDKWDKLGRQNFYMKADDGLPMVYDYVERDKAYWIITRDTTIQSAWVKFFKPNLQAARPPMSGGMPNKRTIKSDTTFKISFSNGVSQEMHFSKQGYYHIFLDSNQQKGFTVFQFTTHYPYISFPMQMVMPLRYLSTKTEFNKILAAKDKKKAVDDFWIKIAGNKDRARRMISLYYNRVQEANKLFYSDREGWMTDRGMIFIVFGPPDQVFRDANMETWTYGYQKNNKSLRFNFYKTNNPFSNADFLLDRTPAYSTPWNNTMEIWRR
jgi:GWxTD domain-containing protein